MEEKIIYTKPVLSYKEQLALLKERGLIIEDIEKAAFQLSHLNYYRLSAYMLPYKPHRDSNEEAIKDKFRTNTTWSNIFNLYKFDRKLRLLVFDQIEKIEISFRSIICYTLAHKYGSHWQDNPDIFSIETVIDKKSGAAYYINMYDEIQKHIAQELSKKHTDTFIHHYRDKYSSPVNPPSWMFVEIMYFSQLSKIFQSLNKRADRAEIAKIYGLPEDILASWMHTINYVRNICAHHSRLWNREFSIPPKKLSYSMNGKPWITHTDKVQRSRMYYFFCMLRYLLDTINPNNNFALKLLDLINSYSEVDVRFMGFDINWNNEPFWNITKK